MDPLTKVNDTSNEVRLTISKNADCNFDVRWFTNDTEDVVYDFADLTAIPLIAVEGWVAEQYDSEFLIADLSSGSGYTTIVEGYAQVRIPGEDTAGFDYLERGVWELIGIAQMSGERKVLARGPVQILEDV